MYQLKKTTEVVDQFSVNSRLNNARRAPHVLNGIQAIFSPRVAMLETHSYSSEAARTKTTCTCVLQPAQLTFCAQTILN